MGRLHRWYYLRFTDPKNADSAWSEKAHADWMPVDLYVGGAEHAVLHLLYAASGTRPCSISAM
ncbi:MAG: hypothetical protein R3B70_33940 [Polyangiaceae bacterium]